MTKIKKKSEVLLLLERWWDISNACFDVGISRQTFYNRLKSNPKFAQAVEFAKTKIDRKSKELIFEAVEWWDLSLAKRYLDKRAKAELFENSKEDDLDQILDEIMDDESELIN